MNALTLNTPIPIWTVLAILGIVLVVASTWDWFRGRYEVTWAGRFPRLTHRWYDVGAHVCLRSDVEGLEIPDRYEVLEWGDDSTPVPWLCVRNMEAEDAAAFWGPVTDFCDGYVRRFHPLVALELLFRGQPVLPWSYDLLPPGRGAPRAGADA